MDLKTKNSCYTYFSIKGNFDPDEITKILNLKPFKIVKIGDKRRDGKLFKFARWDFNKCDSYNPIVEEQMEEVIKPLLSKIDILKNIMANHDVTFTLEIVPHIYVNDIAPALAPSLDIIDFCHETRTNIDIDLYIYENEED